MTSWPGRAWASALLLVPILLLLLAHTLATRQALRAQLEAGNHDAAAMLAAALSRQEGGVASWRAVAAAQFASGRTRLLRLQAADGSPPFEMQVSPRGTVAPDWFDALLPMDVEPGKAVVTAGTRPLGEVQVATDTAASQDALWLSTARAAAVGLVAWLASAAALRWWRARQPAAAAPQSAETMLQLRAVAAAQAEQVSQLQRQAQLDAVTGLPLRRHFLGRLQQSLAEPGGPGTALLLVRVLQLEALNQRLGHEDTDQLLGAVADVLMTYVDRVPGTFAGRLNGSDFALCLPVPGVALETAESLRGALSAAPALRAGAAEVAVGGVDGLHDTTGSLALGAADAALARAEAGADCGASLVVETHANAADAPIGARAWREQITAALDDGRTALSETIVQDREGRALHLECRLRVQLQPGAEYQAADRWLAQARRSRLLPQVDLAAVDLAMRAIAQDGHSRAVHASPLSLATAGFVAEVAARLIAQPAAARRLTIECAEGLRPASGTAALANAAAAWRPLGVHVGVVYAAADAQWLPDLHTAGIDHVKVDARHLHGVASEPAVQGYAQSLVALIHSLGLSVLAVGITDARDLQALWALGFDGAGGPAIEQR
jgi:predicted signal transduction protein with EAL and GGDEF domain